jgi:hypothetical protein
MEGKGKKVLDMNLQFYNPPLPSKASLLPALPAAAAL